MNRINTELLLKMKDKDKVLLHIESLKDYAVFISTSDEKNKQSQINTEYGIYTGGVCDSKRREKYDEAVYALKELNKLSEKLYGEKIYKGSFDDRYREETARAIMVLSEEILDLR